MPNDPRAHRVHHRYGQDRLDQHQRKGGEELPLLLPRGLRRLCRVFLLLLWLLLPLVLLEPGGERTVELLHLVGVFGARAMDGWMDGRIDKAGDVDCKFIMDVHSSYTHLPLDENAPTHLLVVLLDQVVADLAHRQRHQAHAYQRKHDGDRLSRLVLRRQVAKPVWIGPWVG